MIEFRTTVAGGLEREGMREDNAKGEGADDLGAGVDPAEEGVGFCGGNSNPS